MLERALLATTVHEQVDCTRDHDHGDDYRQRHATEREKLTEREDVQADHPLSDAYQKAHTNAASPAFLPERHNLPLQRSEARLHRGDGLMGQRTNLTQPVLEHPG